MHKDVLSYQASACVRKPQAHFIETDHEVLGCAESACLLTEYAGAAGVADEQKRALLTRASAHSSGVQEAVETERLSIVQARGYIALQCLSIFG
jgi:hypothetical protein